MGFFKDIHLQILEWKACGETVENTYIYFKDYVTYEDVVSIFENKYDVEPVEKV
jgi:hypothetical protein